MSCSRNGSIRRAAFFVPLVPCPRLELAEIFKERPETKGGW